MSETEGYGREASGAMLGALALSVVISKPKRCVRHRLAASGNPKTLRWLQFSWHQKIRAG